MQLIRSTTEADMVAVFLGAEIESERFGPTIRELLERHGRNRAIVDTPDLANSDENRYRRELLSAYRAYVFQELPPHIEWYRASLNRAKVAQAR
jgi:ethanolamine utilization protein EutP (predicted NTPase)